MGLSKYNRRQCKDDSLTSPDKEGLNPSEGLALHTIYLKFKVVDLIKCLTKVSDPLLTDNLIPQTGVAEINTQWHFKYPLLVQTPINLASFPKLSGTGMTYLIR